MNTYNNINPLGKNIYYNYDFGEKIDYNPDLKLTDKLITDCKNIIKKTLKNMLFSRFPYFIYNDIKGNFDNPEIKSPDSNLASKKYHAGNCVSFAYYVRNHLEELNNNYKCYLICAGVPAKFKKKNYSKICHVANCIPYDKGFILIDSAFYINEPIIVEFNKPVVKDINSIYKNMTEKWQFKLVHEEEEDKQNISYLDYIIPGDIYAIETTLLKDIQSFKYYLIEILNPDLSITIHTNFGNERVFIASTDEKGLPKGYLCILINSGKLEGYSKKNYFDNLNFSEFITKNKNNVLIDLKKLYSWEGLSKKQANDLNYDVDKLREDFLKVIVMCYQKYNIIMLNDSIKKYKINYND